MKRSSGFRAAALPLVAIVFGGMVASANAQSITDKLNSWLFGSPRQQQEPSEANTPAEIDCPGVTVRAGASTLAVTTPGTEAGPMTTRYQASIGQTASQCAPLGGMLAMKVGVQGRVLLGPAGGPGKLDVPLRMAVVREGTEPKVIWSKFYKLPVAIPPGQTAVPFEHVAQDVSFPMPSARDLEAYVVYVGFDPGAGPEKPAPRKKKKKQ